MFVCVCGLDTKHLKNVVVLKVGSKFNVNHTSKMKIHFSISNTLWPFYTQSAERKAELTNKNGMHTTTTKTAAANPTAFNA